MQQQIAEMNLILEAKIQTFLVSLKQCYDNLSKTVPSPHEQNNTSDAIYSNFLTSTVVPHYQETLWHHHIWWLNSQDVPTSVCTSYSTSNDYENSATLWVPPSLPPLNLQTVPRPIPTAPTKPPFYDAHSSKGKQSLPLTGPMLSYCPPRPPPHQILLVLNQRRSEPTKVPAKIIHEYPVLPMTYHTVWCGFIHIHHSRQQLPSTTSPTASEKNLLRPP